MGKSTINGPCSMAMLNSQRVYNTKVMVSDHFSWLVIVMVCLKKRLEVHGWNNVFSSGSWLVKWMGSWDRPKGSALPLSEPLMREMDGKRFGPSRQLQNSSPRIIILLMKGIRYFTLTHSGWHPKKYDQIWAQTIPRGCCIGFCWVICSFAPAINGHISHPIMTLTGQTRLDYMCYDQNTMYI